MNGDNTPPAWTPAEESQQQQRLISSDYIERRRADYLACKLRLSQSAGNNQPCTTADTGKEKL